MHDIGGMPAILVPEDDIYRFRQRARDLMHKWSPMLDARNMTPRWVVDDNGLSLRLAMSIEY